jgi:hypothetical protein
VRVRRVVLTVVVGAGVVLGGLPGVPGAVAAVRPAVSFSFVSADVAAGQAPHVRYAVSGVPRGGSVVLQRRVGTAGVWRSAKVLTRSGRSAVAPAVGMGLWRYRVVVRDASRHVLAAKGRQLRAYSHLRLGDYLSTFWGGGSLVVGDRTFVYVGQTRYGHPQPFHADSTPCRRLHVDLGAPTSTTNDWVWTSTIVQQSRDSVSATTGPGVVDAVEAAIVPGQSWAVEVAWSSGNPNADVPGLSFNGWLDCYAAPTVWED